MLKPAVYKCEVLSQNGRTWPCIVFSCELSTWLNTLILLFCRDYSSYEYGNEPVWKPIVICIEFLAPAKYFSTLNTCEQTRLCIFIIQYGEYKHHLWRETTKRGPQVRGLPSWTWSMDYLCGSRTTPVDHSRGPLARHQILGVWILDCAWKNVLESSSVIIIVETLHKMWSSKSIHYMTILKYKCAIIRL
jgi:hypothetical protein